MSKTRSLRLVRLRPAAPAANARVRPIVKEEWAKARLARFAESVEWAAAAKEYRTCRFVTQEQVGSLYGYTGARIGQWESGHYFSWDLKKFEHYCKAVNRIAEGRA